MPEHRRARLFALLVPMAIAAVIAITFFVLPDRAEWLALSAGSVMIAALYPLQKWVRSRGLLKAPWQAAVLCAVWGTVSLSVAMIPLPPAGWLGVGIKVLVAILGSLMVVGVTLVLGPMLGVDPFAGSPGGRPDCGEGKEP